jgi:hypothetical protein
MRIVSLESSSTKNLNLKEIVGDPLFDDITVSNDSGDSIISFSAFSLEIKPRILRFVQNSPEEAPKRVKLPKPNGVITKYWGRRYHYWTRYDCGIKMDHRAWYEVSSENCAEHIANRLFGFASEISNLLSPLKSRKILIVEGCCGVGGNTAQLSLAAKKFGSSTTDGSSPVKASPSIIDTPDRSHDYSVDNVLVIAIDLCPKRLGLATHNVGLYNGLGNHLRFVESDFLAFDPVSFLGDIDEDSSGLIMTFISPPWGGPSIHDQYPYYQISEEIEAMAMHGLSFSSVVSIFLPCFTDLVSIFSLVERLSLKLEEWRRTQDSYHSELSLMLDKADGSKSRRNLSAHVDVLFFPYPEEHMKFFVLYLSVVPGIFDYKSDDV